MNILIYLLFLSLFLLDFLSITLGLVSRYVTWMPEILSLVSMVVVAALFATKKINIDKKYLVFLVIFMLHIMIGIIINTVPSGALVPGLRFALRSVPFFLLPALYNFSDTQILKQLRLLMFLVLLQFPIVLYQRFIQYAGNLSGDPMRGTLGTSSLLTVTLYCALAIVVGFYVKKIISLTALLVVGFMLFIPTTLNETKSSLVLMPISLFVPFLLVRGKKIGFSQKLSIATISVICVVAFVMIYDHFQVSRWGYGILDYFRMEGRVENYFYKGVEEGDLIDKIGRLDSILLPIKILSHDVTKLLIGLGVGNVSSSFIGGLSGEYASVYAKYGVGITAIGHIIWETGVLGLLLYCVFGYMVFKDAHILSSASDIRGAFATGWVAVVIIMFITLAYKNIYQDNIISYLFWYLSGYIVSSKYRYSKSHKISGSNHVLLNKNAHTNGYIRR